MSQKNKVPKSVLKDKIKSFVFFQDEQIANVFKRLEEPERLVFYDDIWSLVHPKSYDNSAGFVFDEESVKKGYVTLGKGDNTLNLIDGKRKVIIPITSSVYHFLAEDMSEIVRAVSGDIYKDLEIIIDISGCADLIKDRPDYDMYWLLFQSFKDKKIDHKIVNLSAFNAVYVDNFFLGANGYSDFERFKDIYEYFLDYVKEKDSKPTKKVYLSRTKVPEPEFVQYNNPITNEPETIPPTRIDDHERLEALFKSLGFEIVHPEDFETFEEQLNFFHSVKTLASLTSSGLTNSIFMQPGGNVIEIITPLTARPVNGGQLGFLNKEFHNYYKNIATTKSHFYIGLPNPYASMDDLDNFLLDNENVRKILKQIK